MFKQLPALFIITLLIAGIRIYYADIPAYWDDSDQIFAHAMSYTNLEPKAFEGDAYHLRIRASRFQGYYLLTSVLLAAVGDMTLVFAILHMVLITLYVFFMVLLGWRMTGNIGIGASLATISLEPLYIYQALTVSNYGYLDTILRLNLYTTLLPIGGVVGLWVFRKPDETKRWMLFAFLIGLSWYTHMVGAYYTSPLLVILLFQNIIEGKVKLTALFPVGLSFILGIFPTFATRLLTPNVDLPQLTWPNETVRVNALTRFINQSFYPDIAYNFDNFTIPFFMTLPLFLIWLVALYRNRHSDGQMGQTLGILTVILVAIQTYFASFVNLFGFVLYIPILYIIYLFATQQLKTKHAVVLWLLFLPLFLGPALQFFYSEYWLSFFGRYFKSSILTTETIRAAGFIYFGFYFIMFMFAGTIWRTDQPKWFKSVGLGLFFFFVAAQANTRPTLDLNLVVGLLIMFILMYPANLLKRFGIQHEYLRYFLLGLTIFILFTVWDEPQKLSRNGDIETNETIFEAKASGFLLLFPIAMLILSGLFTQQAQAVAGYAKRAAIPLALVGVIASGILFYAQYNRVAAEDYEKPSYVSLGEWVAENTPVESKLWCFLEGYSCERLKGITLRPMGSLFIRGYHPLDLLFSYNSLGPKYSELIVNQSAKGYFEMLNAGRLETLINYAVLSEIDYILSPQESIWIHDLIVLGFVEEITTIDSLGVYRIIYNPKEELTTQPLRLYSQEDIRVLAWQRDEGLELRLDLWWSVEESIKEDLAFRIELYDENTLVYKSSIELLSDVWTETYTKNWVPDVPYQTRTLMQTHMDADQLIKDYQIFLEVLSPDGELLQDHAIHAEIANILPNLRLVMKPAQRNTFNSVYQSFILSLPQNMRTSEIETLQMIVYDSDYFSDLSLNDEQMQAYENWRATKESHYFLETGYTHLLVDSNWINWLSEEEYQAFNDPNQYRLIMRWSHEWVEEEILLYEALEVTLPRFDGQ